MLKFNSWRYKTLIYYLNKTLQSLNPNPLLQQYPSLFSLHFCTNTSDDSTPLPVSYLINNFGFSPKSASKLCSTYNVRFKTAQKPDSVLNFFRNHGFSDTQLHHIIIAKSPWLLSCNHSKRLLPKFQFLLSKGASNSDIVNLVTKAPMVLCPSLENHIVPTYELLYRFLQSDKDVIACVIGNPTLLTHHFVSHNIRVLIEN
jgi:mTERF domain-containing protein